MILCGVVLCTYGQKKRKATTYNKPNKKQNDIFLQKQWWIGLKAGVNLSDPRLDKSYAILSPTNYEATNIGKEYESFKSWGKQISLEATFYFKGFSASIQPTYQHTGFRYTNHFEWTDGSAEENSTNQLTLNYNQDQRLEHFILPLILKYEVIGNKIRPYIQVGGFAGILLNASKSVEVSGVDYASGGKTSFKEEPIIVGAKDLFAKTHYGILGGAGVYYNLGNIRLNLDIQYKFAMTNITSTKNRYNNDRLAGIGDAMDDLKLDNVAVSIGTLFPLRFLSSGFKSLDQKK